MGAPFVASYFCLSQDPDTDNGKPHAPSIVTEVGIFPSKVLLVPSSTISTIHFVFPRYPRLIIMNQESVEMYDEVAKLVRDIAIV